jgi:hypothetical protein
MLNNQTTMLSHCTYCWDCDAAIPVGHVYCDEDLIRYGGKLPRKLKKALKKPAYLRTAGERSLIEAKHRSVEAEIAKGFAEANRLYYEEPFGDYFEDNQGPGEIVLEEDEEYNDVCPRCGKTDGSCAYCYDERDDDQVSSTEVYSRALRTFGGNHELAREAASLYPGDFI